MNEPFYIRVKLGDLSFPDALTKAIREAKQAFINSIKSNPSCDESILTLVRCHIDEIDIEYSDFIVGEQEDLLDDELYVKCTFICFEEKNNE